MDLVYLVLLLVRRNAFGLVFIFWFYNRQGIHLINVLEYIGMHTPFSRFLHVV